MCVGGARDCVARVRQTSSNETRVQLSKRWMSHRVRRALATPPQSHLHIGLGRMLIGALLKLLGGLGNVAVGVVMALLKCGPGLGTGEMLNLLGEQLLLAGGVLVGVVGILAHASP